MSKTMASDSISARLLLRFFAMPSYGAGTPAAWYPAESNTTQAGIDLKTALASLSLPATSFAESFDEPWTRPR